MSYVWCAAKGLSCRRELRSKCVRVRAPSSIHHRHYHIKPTKNPSEIIWDRTIFNINNKGAGAIGEDTGELIRRTIELFCPCSTG